jgi:hypothetical protein
MAADVANEVASDVANDDRRLREPGAALINSFIYSSDVLKGIFGKN